MNKYVLYSQLTNQSFGPFVTLCKDNYEITLPKGELTYVHGDVKLQASLGGKFAIVDPNGSVLLANQRIVVTKIKKNKSRRYEFSIKLLGDFGL